MYIYTYDNIHMSTKASVTGKNVMLHKALCRCNTTMFI